VQSDPPASTAVPSTAPSPSLDPAASLDPEIAHAISQRQTFGLRADLEWVLAVAADPGARTFLLDFPMTRAEEAEFEARTAAYDRVAAAVTRYAEGREEEFGGVWIDQQRHLVVAAWTANAELHRLGIFGQLGGNGPLQVVTVRYPEAFLRGITDRIVADRAWLETIDATFESGGADIMANVAELSISSANPDAARLIAAHYGVPADALRVVSDGTGILLRERGTVHGVVRLPDGSAPGDRMWDLRWAPDRPVGSGDCGSEVGFGIGGDGTFELPCAPGGWTLTVHAFVEGQDGSVPIGSSHVVVPEGGDVDVTIVADPAVAAAP
jgi:hypothetical protein